MINRLEEISRIIPIINSLMQHYDCNANIAFNDNDYQVNLIFKKKIVSFQEPTSELLKFKLNKYLAN